MQKQNASELHCWKPYFQRLFNPSLQSKKFDKNAEYIKKWLPNLSHIEPQDLHDWENNYQKYNLNDIVKGESIFCATGITSGDLVSGVKIINGKYITETFVTKKNSMVNVIKKEVPIT